MEEINSPPAAEKQQQDNVDNGNNGHVTQESPAPHRMTVGEYCSTRFSTLRPPMNSAPNPIRLLMMLSGKQWLFFLVAFLSWVRGLN